MSDADPIIYPPPRPEESASERIRRVTESPSGEVVLVGHLLAQFRRRLFGGLFLILAVLGLVPGISFLAGIVLIVPALQMAIGLRAPALPRFILRRAVPVARLRRLSDRAMPWLERIERHVRPRWPVMTHPPVANLAGLMIAGLGLAMLLPVPLSNVPPAAAVACLALGLLERDGLVMAIGLALGAVALVAGWFIGFAVVEAASLFVERYF
jgi:hypothetical protein